MKDIIFISGLSGTGKSTLKEYFDEHPIDGYRVYDFDKGKYICPQDEKDHLEWRWKQTEYWLKTARKNLNGNIGTIIFGLSLYPENISELAGKLSLGASVIKFGYLTTDGTERKKRLFDRGTPHHWKGEKDWYSEFHQKQKSAGAIEIITTGKTINATAGEIIDKFAKGQDGRIQH